MQTFHQSYHRALQIQRHFPRHFTMTSTSIPILVVGARASVTTPFAEAALPDIDGTESTFIPSSSSFASHLTSNLVTHVCQTVLAAVSEIPHLLHATPITMQPASNLGSNITRSPSERRRPVAIIIGGVYTDEDTAAIKGVVGMEAAIIKADGSRVKPGEFPPNPIFPIKGAERLRETFREMGMTAEGVGKEVLRAREGGLWYY